MSQSGGDGGGGDGGGSGDGGDDDKTLPLLCSLMP